MNVKISLFAAALSAAVFGFSAPAKAVIQTDVIFIVDESGSMGGVQTNLRNNIGLFANILTGGGQVDAQYGLVGYGNTSVVPRMLTDLTSAGSFATAAQGLVASGGTEPAYIASAFALNALDNQSSLFSFRPTAIKNLIILTDEPSNGDTIISRGAVNGLAVSFAVIDGLLTSNNALYNAVLSGTSTIASIGPLATGHGGAVFSLTSFASTNQAVVQQFVTDFATAKLQETLDFCTQNPTAPACVRQGVSTPSSMALIGAGLLLAGLYRRRALMS